MDEEFEERAAIMEFDGGLSKDQAEEKAIKHDPDQSMTKIQFQMYRNLKESGGLEFKTMGKTEKTTCRQLIAKQLAEMSEGFVCPILRG